MRQPRRDPVQGPVADVALEQHARPHGGAVGRAGKQPIGRRRGDFPRRGLAVALPPPARTHDPPLMRLHLDLDDRGAMRAVDRIRRAAARTHARRLRRAMDFDPFLKPRPRGAAMAGSAGLLAAFSWRRSVFFCRSCPTCLRSDTLPGHRLDGRPAASSHFLSRPTSACNDSASFAVRRIAFVSSRASATLSRPASNIAFHEPALERAPISARRHCCAWASATFARASASSPRTRSRSYRKCQPRDSLADTDSASDPIPSPPLTSVSSAPTSASRIAMQTTIAQSRLCYQPPGNRTLTLDSVLAMWFSNFLERLSGQLCRNAHRIIQCSESEAPVSTKEYSRLNLGIEGKKLSAPVGRREMAFSQSE